MFRILDIPANYILGNCTRRPDVVAILPQATSPEIPLFEFRVALENRSSRETFELLRYLGRTPFRVSFHEQMNVVGSNLHRHNLVTEPLGSPPKQFRKFVSNELHHPVTVLRTPHEVILTQTNRMYMTPVFIYPNLYVYYHLLR